MSTLVHALIKGNTNQIITAARELLQQAEQVDVLLGRIGMIAAHGDPDGHPSITLAAAAMLSRLLPTIPAPIDSQIRAQERALPLFVQALLPAIPSVRAGYQVQLQYPDPLFPSELPEGKTVNDIMRQAVYSNDVLLTERLLFGLYNSGADYRTLEARTYEGLATIFQNAGHALTFTIRGFQLLDTVEWGDRVPTIIHWLAPHLSLRSAADEPSWVSALRAFVTDPAHSVESIRARISFPKDENALPLRQLVTSDADTTRVCQGVYDALIKGEASPRAVASVIALAAADIIQKVDHEDRGQFVHIAHGLLFAAAVRQIVQRVQDVGALPLLFTSAAFINTLDKEVTAQRQPETRTTSGMAAGGLIAVSQLETLDRQLKAQDYTGALTTARRYLKLGYDPRAIFATIGLAAALTDASNDQGHTLQIVQATAEEYLAWPRTLPQANIEGLLQIALRAAVFGKRDTVLSQL
jgi:hypothetical protein